MQAGYTGEECKECGLPTSVDDYGLCNKCHDDMDKEDDDGMDRDRDQVVDGIVLTEEDKIKRPNVSIISCLKMMETWRYQYNEGDVPDDAAYLDVETCIGLLALKLLAKTGGYARAA